jgi:hypothetical protein
MAASRGQVLKVGCQLGGGNSRILMTDKGALPFQTTRNDYRRGVRKQLPLPSQCT